MNDKQESFGQPALPLVDPKTVLITQSDHVSPVHSDLPEGPIPSAGPEHVRDPHRAYSDLPKGPTAAVRPEHVRYLRNVRPAEVQEVLAEITNLKERLQSLIAIEGEIVETESWNFDASVMLSLYANKLGGIPFGTAADFYDMKPTCEDLPSQQEGKGKDRDLVQATSPKPGKRAVLNLDPKEFQDSWWATSFRKSLHTSEGGSCFTPYFLFIQ